MRTHLSVIALALALTGCARRPPPPATAVGAPPAADRLTNVDLQTIALPDPAVVEVYDVTDGKRIHPMPADPPPDGAAAVDAPPARYSADELARGFPMPGEHSLVEVKRYRTLRGPDAAAFAARWRDVEVADGPGIMCHFPGYAFRCLDAAGRVTFATSVCWGCGNFYLRRGDGSYGSYNLRGGPGTDAMLAYCKRITTEAGSHAVGDPGAPPFVDGPATPYVPDALDAFEAKDEDATDADLLALRGFSRLESLFVYSPHVTDAGLAVLPSLRGLRSLTLRAPKVTAAGLAAVASLDRLEMLQFIGMPLTDAGLAHVAGLTRLESLGVYGDGQDVPSPVRGVTDAGLVHLRRLAKLRSLGLSATAVTDAGLASLAHLVELRSLDLSRSAIAGTGLDALRGLPALEDVTVAEAAVTDDGLAAIARLPALQQLNVSENARLTDAGMSHLAAAQKLYRLNLDHTAVGDDGLRRLKGAPSLTHLDMSHTQLTDAAVDLMAAMPKLKAVWAHETRITVEGQGRLQDLQQKWR